MGRGGGGAVGPLVIVVGVGRAAVAFAHGGGFSGKERGRWVARSLAGGTMHP